MSVKDLKIGIKQRESIIENIIPYDILLSFDILWRRECVAEFLVAETGHIRLLRCMNSSLASCVMWHREKIGRCDKEAMSWRIEGWNWENFRSNVCMYRTYKHYLCTVIAMIDDWLFDGLMIDDRCFLEEWIPRPNFQQLTCFGQQYQIWYIPYCGINIMNKKCAPVRTSTSY